MRSAEEIAESVATIVVCEMHGARCHDERCRERWAGLYDAVRAAQIDALRAAHAACREDATAARRAIAKLMEDLDANR